MNRHDYFQGSEFLFAFFGCVLVVVVQLGPSSWCSEERARYVEEVMS